MNTDTSTNTIPTPVKDFSKHPLKLNPNSPDYSFPETSTVYGQLVKENQVLCPVCEGHGGWHITKRSCGVHCSQCNGWGWVTETSTDSTCIHKDREMSRQECADARIVHFGMCYHVYECTQCGRTKSIDSSG